MPAPGIPLKLDVHPAIRILTLVAFAALLPQLGLRDLALLGVGLLLAFLAVARAALPRLALGLLRLRWLWLAIFVLYLGFTPGDPLREGLPFLTREGLAEGLRRALLLAVLLGAVILLLALTPTTQLLIGLRFLARPAGPAGARFAGRLALTLEEVGVAQQRLAALRLSRPSSLVGALVLAIGEVEDAARATPGPVAIPVATAPRAWEWALPLALGAVALGFL